MIRTLCEKINISDWLSVLESQQIEVNGFNVALFPDQDTSTSLAMYVELAKHDANAKGNITLCLLESNAATCGAMGFFGVLPEHGIIVYRTTLKNAESLSCEVLLSAMVDLVACGTAQFHDVMSRHSGGFRIAQKNLMTLHHQRRGLR